MFCPDPPLSSIFKCSLDDITPNSRNLFLFSPLSGFHVKAIIFFLSFQTGLLLKNLVKTMLESKGLEGMAGSWEEKVSMILTRNVRYALTIGWNHF